MSEIKAGVVFVSKFCVSGADKFSGYVDYIDREEAVRNDNIYKFNLYNNYMGNPDKTDGLFIADKDNLTQEEKTALKAMFLMAQDNGSVMWQNVLSFDNRWLKENGMYNEEENIINSAKLKEFTRLAMMKLQKNEGLENALWSAAIHHNTDNIHIHIAMVEPIPMREKKGNEIRGKLKLSSLEKAKSSVVNAVLRQQQENDMINNIIRNNIIGNKRNTNMFYNNEFTRLFMQVHASLPEDRRMWNYGMNGIKELIPLIDRMSDIYLQEFHKEDMHELDELLKVQDRKYRQAYGQTKKDARYSYAENKKKDLYYRLGNVILKEIKQFDYDEKKRIYMEARQNAYKISQEQFNLYRNNQLKYSESQAALKATVELTRMLMKDECVKMKDQLSYQRMVSEIEYKNQLAEEQEEDKY